MVGCAQADGPSTGRDTFDLAAGSNDDFAGVLDFAGFGSGGGADLSDPAASPDDGGTVPVGCTNAEHVVVNEVKTAGSASANDEYIELYNPCALPVNLTNWRLIYHSQTGTADVGIVTFAKTIPGKGYFLVAETMCGCSAMADQTYAAGKLSGTAGGVGLKNALNALVDSVGYGAGTTNEFVEGAPAPAPATGQSTARTPNGADTNKNNVDFVIASTPTPKAAN
ncbi:MAG: LigC protein [Myxococcales bacterium]|nr:LigC protein [Myxococcales bacterium]